MHKETKNDVTNTSDVQSMHAANAMRRSITRTSLNRARDDGRLDQLNARPQNRARRAIHIRREKYLPPGLSGIPDYRRSPAHHLEIERPSTTRNDHQIG